MGIDTPDCVVNSTIGAVHIHTRRGGLSRAIVAHNATATAICNATLVLRRDPARLTDTAINAPMRVPAMRPANEVVVSSSRSCETIRAEIADHAACGNPTFVSTKKAHVAAPEQRTTKAAARMMD